MAKSFDIPTIAERSATLAGLIEKDHAIASAIAALEIEDTSLRYDEAPVTTAADERRARAAAILGDAGPVIRSPSAAERADRLSAIASELADLRTAKDIVRERVAAERAVAGALVCAAVKPHYEAALRDTAIALANARDAYAIAVRITDNLWNEQGVVWNSHLAQPHNLASTLANTDRSDTPVDMFISDVVAAGLVKRSEVEKVLSR